MASRPTHDTELADAAALAEQAEAEAAEAEAAAAAARSRLDELRAQSVDADLAADEPADSAEVTEVTEPADDDPAAAADEPARTRRRLPRPAARTLAAGVGVLLLCALLGVSAFMFWQGQREGQRQDREAQFSAAARQGVVNLMSLDFNRGEEDLQRLIDSTTGQFRQDFEKSRGDFMSVMTESKVVTSAEVKATAVESMTDDSAVVLVAATSQVSNSASAKPTPRAWRLAVSLQRDDGRLKMSKVEFVP